MFCGTLFEKHRVNVWRQSCVRLSAAASFPALERVGFWWNFVFYASATCWNFNLAIATNYDMRIFKGKGWRFFLNERVSVVACTWNVSFVVGLTTAALAGCPGGYRLSTRQKVVLGEAIIGTPCIFFRRSTSGHLSSSNVEFSHMNCEWLIFTFQGHYLHAWNGVWPRGVNDQVANDTTKTYVYAPVRRCQWYQYSH